MEYIYIPENSTFVAAFWPLLALKLNTAMHYVYLRFVEFASSIIIIATKAFGI